MARAERFKLSTIEALPQILCDSCTYRSPADERECLAFPDGIPEEILTGAVRHDRPYPGDNTIQYAPK